jgi:hypothetical protein
MPFFLRLAIKRTAANWKPLALAFAFALGLAVPARGGLSFSLTPSVQSGLGTNEVVFTAAVTNLFETNNLYLNDIQLGFTNAATNYLTPDTNAYFANVPGILLAGGNYTGVVFGVPINPMIPPGNYGGVVAFFGGTNIFATNLLASQTFQVSLPCAPLGVTKSGTNAVLFWPSPPAGFVLQQTPGITIPNWVAAPYTSVQSNNMNQVVFPPSSGSQFYRLEYP